MLRPLYFFLLLILGATQLPACAQSATDKPAAVAEIGVPGKPLPWLDSILSASPILARHQVGMSLAYADSTRPFYGFQDSKYFTPASTMKLFSFYTGLHLLGDSLPSLRYFSRHDTLFFQGTGDPTLLHGDVPSRRAYSFLLNRPEHTLAYCDIATVTPYGPGWTWDDYGYYFQPERAAFPIYGNTVRFYATPPAPVRGGARPAAAPQSRIRVLPRYFAPLVGLAPAELRSSASTPTPTSFAPRTKTASTCCPP
jgi:D-alanyl-D-alanine carboxypeptidase/D-alanyl-D-alanine-endopeptidase (penicillin-binding protein 4)